LTKDFFNVKVRQNDEFEDTTMSTEQQINRRETFAKKHAKVLTSSSCENVQISKSMLKALDRGFEPITKGENQNVNVNQKSINMIEQSHNAVNRGFTRGTSIDR
jgi:hypothetical protein